MKKFICVLTAAFLSFSCYAAEIIVNPGQDTQAAINSARPGDIVRLRPGQHRGADIRGRREFSAAQRLFIVGDVGAEVVSRTVTGDGINIEQSHFVTLDNITVTGSINGLRAGIRVAEADNVTIRNCRSNGNNLWGFFTAFANNLLFEDCSANANVQQHGFYVSNSCKKITLRRVTSTNNGAAGLHFNGDRFTGPSDGRPVTGLVEELLIDTAILTGNGARGGAALNMDGVKRFDIFNVTLRENRAGGVAMFQQDGAEPTNTGRIMRCDLEQPATAFGVSLALRNGATDIIVWGNRMKHHSNFRPEYLLSNARVTSNYNQVGRIQPGNDDTRGISLQEWQNLSGQDRRSVDHSGVRPTKYPFPFFELNPLRR